MFLIVSFIILILVASFYAKFYVIPIYKINKLAKQFQDHGYKVKNLKFSFLGYALGDMMKQNNMRLQFLKSNFTQYDVAIGNILSKVAIIPISFDLVKDCFMKTKQIAKSQFDSELYCYFNDGGVVFSEGQKYKRKKKIISSVFHYDFIASLTAYIPQTVDQKLKLVQKNINQRKPIKSRVFFGQILSQVISKYFLGVSMNDVQIDGKRLPQYIQKFTDDFNSYIYSEQHILFGRKGLQYNLSQKSRKLKKSYKAIGEQIDKVVKSKLKQFKENKNLNKNLLFSFIENNMLSQKASEDKYSYQQIIGEFFIFYVGGIDTTSALLTVLMYVLAKNPKILQNLRKQCDPIKQSQINSQILKKMVYTEGVINEGLRMYGPAALSFIRQVKSNTFTLGNGVKLPYDYEINYVNMIHHYDQKVFKNPHEFRPQRWQQQAKSIDPFAFLPFGAGQRTCLGRHLAKLQMKVVLMKMVKKFDIIVQSQLDMQFGFVYRNSSQEIILVERNTEKLMQP